ncbi:MAG: helix-turn-helix transcriptional regulator [Lachnospiraceae bacterium]|nr:helix-turn-helix transcriptional regulator [Lachnospiraceae bacterium]
MYSFDPLFKTMEKRGITTYQLVNHYNISSHLMSNLRHNRNVTIETLYRLWEILGEDCTLDDIVKFTKDNE